MKVDPEKVESRGAFLLCHARSEKRLIYFREQKIAAFGSSYIGLMYIL